MEKQSEYAVSHSIPATLQVIASDDLLSFGMPEFKSPGAAGIDLRAMLNSEHSDLSAASEVNYVIDDGEGRCYGISIPPDAIAKIDSGLRIWINDSSKVGIVVPRSSMGMRGIGLANTVGIIDSDYQGPLVMLIKNVGDKPVYIENGERLCQYLLMDVQQFDVQLVPEFDANTVRGSGGFGSTGRL